jgi:hypothetical protein
VAAGAACGAGVSDAAASERDADIFWAETMPKAARPRIIKTATMLITKRIIRSCSAPNVKLAGTDASAAGANQIP